MKITNKTCLKCSVCRDFMKFDKSSVKPIDLNKTNLKKTRWTNDKDMQQKENNWLASYFNMFDVLYLSNNTKLRQKISE